jgi:hypothetical protein
MNYNSYNFYISYGKFEILKISKHVLVYIINIETISLGLSDVCMLLYFVPRPLISHTSNPLSAKINSNDSSGELNSHTSIQQHPEKKIIGSNQPHFAYLHNCEILYVHDSHRETF